MIPVYLAGVICFPTVICVFIEIAAADRQLPSLQGGGKRFLFQQELSERELQELLPAASRVYNLKEHIPTKAGQHIVLQL